VISINMTLFGQMITFLLFVWFTKRFVWPPLTKALKDRQAKIADGLAAAERGHLELSRAKESALAEIKRAKDAASHLLVDAKKQSDHVIDQARQKAHEEGQRIIQQAQAEIEQQVLQAKESLREQVATIALFGAEKILEKSVDSSVHQKMLEQLAEEI
jgi:F-type H+-transporting ATPase subunit b